MKPLHIGLLVLGAGIAGGLALKMTQLQPISVEAPPPSTLSVSPSTDLSTDVPVRKPSPLPPRAVRAAAPETVYTEPVKPVARKIPPVTLPAPIRKNEPIPLASIKPKQWIPGKYDSFGDPGVASRKSSSQMPAKAGPAPVLTASTDKAAATPVVAAVEKEPVPEPQPPAPHQATLRSGMTLAIRLNETLSTDYSRGGSIFSGTLVDPLIADGFVIAERGSNVSGRVLESQKAGRSTGTSRLELGLTNIVTSDGQQVAISTEPWVRLGDNIPSETVIRFRLTSRVTITERQLAAK